MLYKKGVTGHKENTNLTTAQTDATQRYTAESSQAQQYPVIVDRTKPYSGELPPQPLDPSIDPKIFVQDPVTKIWAKRNALGHLRKVDNVGNEWYKTPFWQRKIEWSSNHKAPNALKTVWQTLSAREKVKWWDNYFAENPECPRPDNYVPPDKRPSTLPTIPKKGTTDGHQDGDTTAQNASDSRGSGLTPAAPATNKHDYMVTAMGKTGILQDMETQIEEVQCDSTDCPDSDSDADLALPCVSDTEDEQQLDATYKMDTMDKAIPGWTQWEEHIAEHATQRAQYATPEICAASTIEALTEKQVPDLIDDSDQELETQPDLKNRTTNRQQHKRPKHNISMMDRRGRLTIQKHRRKNERKRFYPFCALVARPVGEREIREQPLAQAAMDAEWQRLRDKGVWDEHEAFEWDDIRRQAKKNGETVHMGYLFGICVEKNSDLSQQYRKYKGRVVFQGNKVINQNYESAIFQDLGSAPATMEASKTADFYGCQEGHTIEVADAEQAYVQADMKGTPTWITLPWEEIPEQFKHMQKPVFRLKKALYGHPDAGTFWEEKVDAHMKKVGFIGLNPEWPSCYYHPELAVYCVIYVDDFKMAGPIQAVKDAWELIRQDGGLVIENPKQIDENGIVFLGCKTYKRRITLPDNTIATAIVYDQQEYLQSCVERYYSLCEMIMANKGPLQTMKASYTPFISEDHKEAPSGKATKGPVTRCPCCYHTFPGGTQTWQSIEALEIEEAKHKKRVKANEQTTTTQDNTETDVIDEDNPQTDPESTPIDSKKVGRLEPIAASMLMKILWAARNSRFDLLRATTHLACYLVKWTQLQDKKLHKMLSYIQTTQNYRLVGWVGDTLDKIQPHLFADADLAGDPLTLRSTSGAHLCLRGPHTPFPISGLP